MSIDLEHAQQAARDLLQKSLWAVEPTPANDECARDAMVLHSSADSKFVRTLFLPLMRAKGLRVATLADLLVPGMDKVVSAERALAKTRRVVVVVSHAFCEEEETSGTLEKYVMGLRKQRDISSGSFSIIPVYVSARDGLKARLPDWFTSLVEVELRGWNFAHEMARLVNTIACENLPCR